MPTRTEVPATATPASPSATTPGNDEEGGGGISGGSIASQSQSVSPDAAAAGSPPPTNVNRHSQSQSDEDDHDDHEDDDGLLFSCRCESARSVTTLLSCLRHVASGGGGSGSSDFALTQGALAAGRRSRADLSLSAIDHTGISGGRGGGIGGGGGGRGGSGRAQHATVFAGEAGLTFHVHGTARQSQASVDMQSGLFSDYYVCEQVVEVDDDDDDGNNDDGNEAEGGGTTTRTKTEIVKGGEFCINLTTVLECLHVLGTNALDRTKLCLSYDLHDAIFRIELLEETHGATGGGIVSTCAIPGLAVSDDYDDDDDDEDGEGGTGASGLAIAFRSCPIVARAIVKSDYLRDAVVELSDVPGAASATIGISPRGMDLAAVGFSTECQVSLPHAGNDAVFVSLDCDPPRLHARTYPLHSILSAFRGLEIASETCISINRRGMVAIQHQVLDEHVGNGQPNFVDFIMGCLQDDDDEDSGDDGYGDEEDDVVVELGREMLTSGTQRSIEEARRRRRRGRHQQQAATATGTAGTGTYASSDEGEDEEAKRREAEDMLKRLGNESSSDEEDGEGGRTKKSKTKDGESEYAQLTMEPTSKSSSRSQRDHERKNRGRRNRGGAKKKASAEDDDEDIGTEDESDSDEFKKSSKRKKKGRKEKKTRSDGRGRKRPSPTTNSGRSKSRRKKSDGDDEANASSDSPSRSPRGDEESEPETDVDSQFYKIGGGNAASNAAQDPPSSPELMYGNTSLGGPSTSMIESRKSANFDDDSDGSF